MVKLTVVLPPVLEPVTVYVPEGVTAVGVPLISPVFTSIDKPLGRVGETVQVVIGPPLAEGIPVEKAESLVRDNEVVP